jgi:hypothetical protein
MPPIIISFGDQLKMGYLSLLMKIKIKIGAYIIVKTQMRETTIIKLT